MNRYSFPPLLVQGTLLIGIAYLAYHYYVQGLQLSAEAHGKLAEAVQTELEADALHTKIGQEEAATAAAMAEMEKLAADARTADAAAQAQGQRMGGLTLREASIRAEIDAATNEGRKLQAELDALMQSINRMPLVVSKTKSEVETAETNMELRLWQEHLYIEGMKRGDWRLYGFGPLLGGRRWKDDGITRYPFTQIFKELNN